MENDSIRSSGTDTLVDIWIAGKVRAICVTQDAIGAFLGFDPSTPTTDRDRCEFVRANLPLIVSAAKLRLDEMDGTADSVTLDLGQLPRADGRTGDRRKGDRRVKERRKDGRPGANQPDRRRRERRQGERRTKPQGNEGA